MVIKQEFLPTRYSIKKCFILIGLVICIYILENSHITSFIDSTIFNYIIRPILWIGLACLVLIFPHVRSKGLLKLRSTIYFWTMNFAIIYIVVSIFAGFIDALGKSPYNHSLTGILTNIIFVGSALVGREFIRSYLVNSFTKKEKYLVFILVALFMTIIDFSINQYTNIKDLEGLVQFIAQYFAPGFAQNLFASYLVYIGGPAASIIYLGIIQGFHWFSPILPDLKWITTALIGILCPVFFMMSLQAIYQNESKQMKIKEKDKESPLSWMLTSIVSIAIIWFAVGVFPIYPSVIATGSMEPMIKPGDVILVKKIVDMKGINVLKVGDVIQFKRDSVLISHRIIEIISDEKEGMSFRTKGDNNSGVDIELVKPQDIKGIVVYTVPKIGWPTLLIKSDKDIPLDEIEF